MRSFSVRAMGTLLALLVLVCGAHGARAQVPNLPVLERRLDNGLRVLIQHDRRAPRVGVAIQYHVGFRTTPRGLRGLPHLVEHLMFTGSQHAPEGAAAYFEPAGGTRMNGMTGQDATVYFVELPARELDLALWIESDRMGYLITALDEAKVAHERSVVLQEWRERVSGRASGRLSEAVQQAMYPQGHPYHLVGDDPNHLSSIRLAHVQWFLQAYYVPNNATLAIVGDVDPASALASVERFFASIPASLDPVELPARAELRFSGSRFLTFEAPTHTDTLLLRWPTPPYLDPDDATLDVLATLLERRLGSMVGGPLRRAVAHQSSHDLASEFTIELELEPGADTGLYVARVDRHLAQLQQDSRLAESLLAYREAAANWITRRYEHYDERAASLAMSPDRHVVSPFLLATRYAPVTVDDLRRVAAEWLPLDRRLVVHVRSVPHAPLGGRVANHRLVVP